MTMVGHLPRDSPLFIIQSCIIAYFQLEVTELDLVHCTDFHTSKQCGLSCVTVTTRVSLTSQNMHIEVKIKNKPFYVISLNNM